MAPQPACLPPPQQRGGQLVVSATKGQALVATACQGPSLGCSWSNEVCSSQASQTSPTVEGHKVPTQAVPKLPQQCASHGSAGLKLGSFLSNGLPPSGRTLGHHNAPWWLPQLLLPSLLHALSCTPHLQPPPAPQDAPSTTPWDTTHPATTPGSVRHHPISGHSETHLPGSSSSVLGMGPLHCHHTPCSCTLLHP